MTDQPPTDRPRTDRPPTDAPEPPVVNIDAVLADPDNRRAHAPGGGFEATIGMIGQALGSRELGVNVTIVPPGKTAWPRHYHYANEELFVILEGAGLLRYGESRRPVGPGDVVSIRAGTGVPFQLSNPGAEPLKYLAFSTMHPADVCVYPDSGKVGLFGGPQLRRPTDDRPKRMSFLRGDAEMRYWDGEVKD